MMRDLPQVGEATAFSPKGNLAHEWKIHVFTILNQTSSLRIAKVQPGSPIQFPLKI
jgi:hypothetical protein